MYTLIDAPEKFEQFSRLSAQASAAILKLLPLEGEAFILSAGANLVSEMQSRKSIFFVREGHLAFSLGGKQLYFYREGDLVGLELCLAPIDCVVSADFGVKLTEYPLEKILSFAKGSPDLLCEILRLQSWRIQLLSLISAELMREEIDLSPEIKHFDKDQIIITQGAAPDLVYTLLEGKAEAIVDGVKVGDIGADQVFGALAVVTDTPRTATVKALSNCVVVGISKERFIKLIQARPQTVLKLVEDMARTIVALNDQVVGLTKSTL